MAKKRKIIKPKVSIIVPFYNAERTIAKTAKSLLNQRYPKRKYEVILVDDGSTDESVNIAKTFKNVKIILQKHAGPAVARNRGVRNSNGDIVLFTDADCIAPKNWIEKMVKPFENKEVVGVAGTYKRTNEKNVVSKFISYEIEDRHASMRNKHSIDFVGTFSAAYRKDAFLKSGGFDEKFSRASAEDTDLSFKISKSGRIMAFAPNAYVYHHHPETLKNMLKKKFWMGYWRVPLYTKHGDKLFRHSYTPKMVFIEEAGICAAFLIMLLGVFNVLPILLSALLAFLIVIILSLPLSIKIFKKDKRVGLLSLGIIPLRDLAVALGILSGIIYVLTKSHNKVV